MVAFPRFVMPRVPSVAPLRIAMIGGAAGLLVGAGIAVLPTDLLETLVWRSGVAALVPAAAPPLGVTARGVLGLAAGGLVAAILWSALYLLVGPGGLLDRPRAEPGIPSVRRADAHPDAPPRRPLSAADLGTPLMDVKPPERPLPRDLEQPLAAFDPAAIPPLPMQPVRPVAPLATANAERIETFELTPPVRTADPAPRPAPAPPQTIEALLRRLEQGAQRRARVG